MSASAEWLDMKLLKLLSTAIGVGVLPKGLKVCREAGRLLVPKKKNDDYLTSSKWQALMIMLLISASVFAPSSQKRRSGLSKK